MPRSEMTLRNVSDRVAPSARLHGRLRDTREPFLRRHDHDRHGQQTTSGRREPGVPNVVGKCVGKEKSIERTAECGHEKPQTENAVHDRWTPKFVHGDTHPGRGAHARAIGAQSAPRGATITAMSRTSTTVPTMAG